MSSEASEKGTLRTSAPGHHCLFPLSSLPLTQITYNLSFWQCQFFGRVAVVELACKCYQLEVSLAKLFAENEGLL
ncbi:MAG: hypothetical protein BRC50_15620 [Cyanobacteria bacterium SW_11_48_12]|nr:MAG: hypothetical protein BRC35_16975 [Cyanobacteria bacterium QH_10_48_56]PSP10200.1 MAG: hypothetical protein BRC50_15620 [Cyanobacteria bacterium SW_11_48_12]